MPDSSSGPRDPRCLFCATEEATRTKEHLFRRAFREKLPSAASLTFHQQTENGCESFRRPISQFDMTVNAVCVDCNSGWLCTLEDDARDVIIELTTGNTRSALRRHEVLTLGYWAYIRALLRTHVSPQGRAPVRLLRDAYDRRASRSTPASCRVLLGASSAYVVEAGAHQSLTLNPSGSYLGFVGFGLGALVFMVGFGDESPEVMRLTGDLAAGLRSWFPNRLRGLAPIELPVPRLGLLTPDEAVTATRFLQIRLGFEPVLDHLGHAIPFREVIPSAAHESLRWTSIKAEM